MILYIAASFGSALQEFSDGFRPGADLQFLINPADIGVDSFVADAELLGDFLVKKALAEAIQDLLLALGKILGRL